MPRTRAFTLMEMTIVLFLLSLMLSVTFIFWPKIQQRTSEQTFFSEFEASYQRLLTESMFTHQSSTIKIPDTHSTRSIVFKLGTREYKRIQIPKTLFSPSQQGEKILVFSEEGLIRPIILSLDSNLSGKRHTYSFQLGWGQIHVKKEATTPGNSVGRAHD